MEWEELQDSERRMLSLSSHSKAGQSQAPAPEPWPCRSLPAPADTAPTPSLPRQLWPHSGRPGLQLLVTFHLCLSLAGTLGSGGSPFPPWLFAMIFPWKLVLGGEAIRTFGILSSTQYLLLNVLSPGMRRVGRGSTGLGLSLSSVYSLLPPLPSKGPGLMGRE